MIWDRTKNIAIFSFIHLPVFKCILLSIQFIATASTVSFSQVPIQILLVEPVVTSPFQPNYCFQMSTPAAVVPHEQELSEHESVSSEVYDSGSGSGRESFSHIQVACRVRPLSKKELALSKQTATPNSKHSKNCLRVDTLGHAVTILKPNSTSNEEKSYQFDYCANGATTQEDVFTQVGLGITKRCMEGHNGTILCYGQTGTGKVQ